ncbi:replication initiation protein [Athalassotoga saccharophila]|uniref:Replication initiation protein n=1 Tax=Athalassotoga saccharophila TaxID=1441386 RepID=A0A6N4TEJ5_9BACT|nr:replication initiation protein [Athalassotoga saccharophila]BBJ29091.1 replication initiation protein [Athalassotoga saccharophila]
MEYNDETLHKVTKVEDKNIVVLDNAIVEARYVMSLNEQKLFLALVSLIGQDDEELKKYFINANALKSILNIQSKNIYDDVKTIARRLVKKTLFIEDKSRKKWVEYPLFSVMEYEDGVLYVEFNQKIKPFLLKIKQEFTKFQLKEFKPFKSKYSIRIYQLLKQYAILGERLFDIIDLRLKLGIEEKELKQFIEFRRYVLDIAQRELENTPMAFDWIAVKEGHKFTKIKFILKNKIKAISALETSYVKAKEQEGTTAQVGSDPSEFQSPEQEVVESINDNERTIGELILLLPKNERTKNAEKLISELLQNHDKEYIAKQIDYTNNHNTKNYLAYLKKAVDNDYANFEKSELEDKIKIEQLTKRMQSELEQLEKKLKHDIDSHIFAEEKRIYKSYMNSLTKEQQEQLRNEFMPKALAQEPGLRDMALDFAIERLITEKIIGESEELRNRISDLKNRLEQNAAQIIEQQKEQYIEQIEGLKNRNK